MPAVIYSAGAVMAGLFFAVLYALPGAAVYYFSNVSFFVALPLLLAAVSGWFVTRYEPTSRLAAEYKFLAIMGFVIILAGAESLYLGSVRRNVVPEARSDLIERLLDIRRASGKNQVVAGSDALIKQNQFSECTARPFLYPAVSERPWVGVISLSNVCDYRDYGYESYNVGASQTRVLPAPDLRGLPLVPVDSLGLIR